MHPPPHGRRGRWTGSMPPCCLGSAAPRTWHNQRGRFERGEGGRQTSNHCRTITPDSCRQDDFYCVTPRSRAWRKFCRCRYNSSYSAPSSPSPSPSLVFLSLRLLAPETLARTAANRPRRDGLPLHQEEYPNAAAALPGVQCAFPYLPYHRQLRLRCDHLRQQKTTYPKKT